MIWNHELSDGFEKIKFNIPMTNGIVLKTLEGNRLVKYFFCFVGVLKISMEKSWTVRGGGVSLGLGSESCQQCLKYQNLSLPEK